MMDSEDDAPVLKLIAQLRLQGAQEPRQPLPPRRRPGRAVRAGEEAHPAHPRASRLHPDQLGPGRGAAAQHHRAAGALRGRGEGGDRARLVPPVQRHPPDLPRPAHGEHRRGAQHDQRQHAHRGAAAAVAEPHPGAAEPVAGAHRSSRKSSSAPTPRWRSRRSSWRRRPSCSRSRTPRSR